MTLTPEDIKRLEAPLPLEHHEARAKGKNKAGTQQQWLIYITQEGVIPLLNEIDPSWTWDVREASKWDKYAVVTGRLTIKDVFRDGRGGNSPNSASASTDEDTEKGAETDALKRAAVKFGIGLYLRGAPVIWLPYADSNKPWEDEQKALDKFAEWYKREFGQQGAQNGKQPQRPPPPQHGANGTQNPPPNGASSSTPSTPPTQGASGSAPAGGNGSAQADLFPDAAQYTDFLCHELVYTVTNGGSQYTFKSEHGANIVVFGSDWVLTVADYEDRDVYKNTPGKVQRLTPPLVVTARFDSKAKKWDVSRVTAVEGVSA